MRNIQGMYGRHFESMYTGSMIGAGAVVFAVWGYVIAKRRRQFVELNPKLLAFTIGESEDDILAAISKLCSPDAASRTKAEEGRRLVQEGQYVYRVVNAEEFDRLAGEADRLEKDRIRKREERAPRPTEEVAPGSQFDPPPQTKKQFSPPTPEELKLCAAKMGLPQTEADKFINYYGSNGWRVGKNPMKNWQMALTNWKIKWETDHANQHKPNRVQTSVRDDPRHFEAERPGDLDGITNWPPQKPG